jgi:hypothetical protein
VIFMPASPPASPSGPDGGDGLSDRGPEGVVDSILARIGRTPLCRLRRLSGAGAGIAEVLAKCEHLNPGGSVKDRAALAMVEATGSC